ncbi:MAG: hypothetical protein JXA30_17535 [Deltaproteobacteria bacterium]|nr:hypothetical protein [Deltaproteobacteria bacterium]
MKSFCENLIALIAVTIVVSGCKEIPAVDRCLEGAEINCTCDNGKKGRSRCVDGVFEDCDCQPDTAYEDVEKNDSRKITDSGDRANKDSNGSGSQFEDAGARIDATEPPDAEENSDAAKANMDADTTEDATFPKTEEDSGRDGEEPDMGIDSDTTRVYGQCDQDECGDDLECVVLSGGRGSYCSIPCEETEQCPDPVSGTAEKRCSTENGRCRLNCANGDCPEAMRCIQTGLRYTCAYETPTSVYGPCIEDQCSEGQQCVEVTSGAGSFCSISCEQTEQCPEPAEGTAVKRCSTENNMCRINCSEGDCPEGMECVLSNTRNTCVWQ